MSVSGKIVDDGVELEGKWAEDKVVLASIHYSLDDKTSLSVTVETPFQGWEKQDLTFTLELKDYEINARASAVWKNSEQMVLSIIGKLEPGLSTHALNTEILFSSSFVAFERVHFNMAHKMVDATIDTHFEGTWNDSEMKGTFQLIPSENGVDGSATLITPFTEEMLLTLHHELVDMALSTILEAKYGAETSTITIKGHLDFGDVHDANLILKMVTPLTAVPEIDANIKYTCSDVSLTLVAEGIIGEKKMMLNINGVKTVTEDSTSISGDLRFITPFTNPLTGTLSHNYDGQKFTSEVEMTRIWSDPGYGSLKVHADGHMISKEDIVLNAAITSPATKATISIKHKIIDGQLTSVVDVSVNGHKLTISASGTVNDDYSLAKLKVEVTSTFNGLNDIKADIDIHKSDSTWISKIILMKDTMSVAIDHSITYTDMLNWENLFTVNNVYHLKNKMTHVDTSYAHEIDYKWDAEEVHVKLFIDPRFSETSRQIDAQLVVATPWTENIKVNLHHEDDGVEYKPTLAIEYMPESIIEIASVLKIEESSVYLETTVTTPFWQPLGYKLNIDFQPQNSVTLVLIRGDNKTTVNVSGHWEDSSKMNCHLEVHSTYLSTPVIIEAEYDLKSPEKMIHLMLTTTETYDLRGLIAGSLREAKWSLTADLPLALVQHIEFTGEYHIMALPLAVNTVLMVNTEKYEVNCVVNAKDILIDMDVNGQKGQLTSKWNLEEILGNIEVKFQSPVTIVDNMAINLVYDFETDKKVNIKWNDGAAELNFTGMVADPLNSKIILAITTPFESLQTLGGEVQWNGKDLVKTVEVKTYFNENQYNWLLEATAESISKGHATSKITTTLSGWTDVTVEGSFDFTAMPYKVVFMYNKEGVVNNFEGQLSIDQNAVTGEITTSIPGWEKVALIGDYTLEDNHLTGNMEFVQGSGSYKVHADMLFSMQPKLKVIINTPITEAAIIELLLDSVMNETERNFHISFKINDIIYSADFSLQMLHKTGIMKVLTTSPIPGYTEVEIMTKYDFTGDVKTAELDLKIEGEQKHFSVATQINDNNVHLNILTPIEGFEDIKMTGDYTVVDGQYNVLASMEKGGEKYDLHADFSALKKQVNLKLSTPITLIKNVQVGLKMDVLETGIEGLVHIELNEDKFEVKIKGDFVAMKSSLHIEVNTPVDDWKTLLLDVKYDFMSDKKTIEMSLQKDTLIKVIKGEAGYNLNHGFFKLEIPVEGFEVLGAEYLLKMDSNLLDANIKIMKNSEEWSFSVHGQYTADNIKIELSTPFDELKFLSAAVAYSWTESKKDITVNVAVNEKSYALTCILSTSVSKSEFTVQAVTPFQSFENMSLVAKYDINNRDELASVHMAAGDEMYNFLMAGYIEEQVAYLQWDLTTPIIGWSNVKFVAHLDVTHQDKMLEISLERDENVKAIAISGKLIGGTIDFNLKTPFSGLQNFKLFGSVDRKKRSLEFKMLSDSAEASLLTSFNSIKVHLKTPFEQAEEITWEITRIHENTYKAEWRRNDNYLSVSVEKQGSSNAFNVQMQSELQGWELMALAGLLDEQTLERYRSGATNEEKIQITGSASLDRVGHMNLNIKTPSNNYKSVDVVLDYNMRQRSVNMEANSASSEFHFKLNFKKAGGLKIELSVPNPEAQLSIDLGLYSGKITMTSGFQRLRNFHYEHHVDVGSVTTIDSKIKINDREVFNLAFRGDSPQKKAHLELRTVRNARTTTIYYQHQAYSSMTFIFSREDGSARKEFRIDATGSEPSPSEMIIDIVINNTFRQSPVTRAGRIHVTKVDEHQKVTIEVTPRPSKLYKFELIYRYADRAGDFSLRTTTPVRRMSPWKNITGRWNMQNLDEAFFEITFGESVYTAQGKLNLYNSDLILNLGPTAENIILQWRFLKEENDYFLKMGQEVNYGMLALKGTFQDLAHVDMEGAFKAGPYMSNELHFTSKWNYDDILIIDETFEYGQYNGAHHLEFNRNAATRSGTFAWTGTSNIPDFSSLSLDGTYDFNNKIVIYGLMKVNNQEESTIDINLADLFPEFSHNTVELKLPGLSQGYRTMQFTVSHDFRTVDNKSFSAVAKVGETEYYIKASWSRSEELDLVNIEMKTVLLGDINIVMDYDISNIHDAHMEIKYTRILPSNEQKFVNMKWISKRTADHFHNELMMNSTFNILTHFRVHFNADYSNDFHLSSGIEWNENIITLIFQMTEDGLSAQLTTPFEHFEIIDVSSTYSLSGKTKKITLAYARGESKVDMEFNLNAKAKKKGNMSFVLTTPFEVLRVLNIVASWKNKSAEINIQRNDTQYKIDGTVDFKMKKSSFDVQFTIPEWQTIRMAASYDVQKFLAGTGTDKERLASLQFEFEGHTVGFILEGFRNRNILNLEIDGNSSFEILRIFHFKLDSEFTNETTEGELEIRLNDFEFKTTSKYEKRGNNGYYMRTRVESTLTPLPALIIGIGRDGAERMVTIGYGEDQEITFSVQGKNGYKDGFFGTFDIPKYGYDGVRYDVSYGFDSDDELHVHIDADLGQSGEKVEAELVYNSEGVRARLTSPFSGQHNMRVRRSVSEDGFSTEASYNDYSLMLRGGFKDGDTKRGAVLEGDVFGNKFLLDVLFQSEGLQYSEGKLLIETPFRGLEKMGGLFTFSNVDNMIEAHAEVLLPSYTTPKIIAEINLDLNSKVDGIVTLDVAGEKFSLKTNLVGASLTEGYQGSVELHTPFHALQSLIANVGIKMVDPTSLEIIGAVNDNNVKAAYTMAESTFKFNLDTLINTVHRQLSVEAKYPSLDALEGTVIVAMGEDSHKIFGKFNIASNHVQGELDIDSTLIDGQRKLSYDISVPNASLDHININLSLVTSETYSLHVELDRTSNFITIIELDTPILPKFTANLEVGAAHASLSVETPDGGVHKAQITWRMTFKMPADYLAALELESSRLPHKYVASIMLSGDVASMKFKAELQAGSEKHLIEADTQMTDAAAQISANIETPYNNINQLSLSASLNFGEKIEMHINAAHADNINTIDVTYDTVNRNFMALANSPLIPTGQASAEVLVTGDISQDMKLKMAINYGEHIISGSLNTKMLSPDNMSTILKVTTPFEDYKEMNFIARYVKDEVTNILISLDRPFKFTIELHLSSRDDEIMADMTVETPIENFEMVQAKIDIPLNVFGPSVSVDMELGGASYGGNFGLRTKAPYELAVGYHAPDMFNGKFHLRTDSSFLTILP